TWPWLAAPVLGVEATSISLAANASWFTAQTPAVHCVPKHVKGQAPVPDVAETVGDDPDVPDAVDVPPEIEVDAAPLPPAAADSLGQSFSPTIGAHEETRNARLPAIATSRLRGRLQPFIMAVSPLSCAVSSHAL